MAGPVQVKFVAFSLVFALGLLVGEWLLSLAFGHPADWVAALRASFYAVVGAFGYALIWSRA